MMTVVVHWAPINVGTISDTCVCSVQAIKVWYLKTYPVATDESFVARSALTKVDI